MAVLDLTPAKAHLNITVATHDAELTALIASAEAAIAKKCGPLEPTTRTERVAGGGALVLPVTPAISLTSVTPADGSALLLADLYVSPAGVVTQNYGSGFCARYYDVVYQAGRSTCPGDLLLAVKELVRHLWDTQRGPTRRPASTVSSETANTIPGAAYMFPFRVSELMADHIQPGFA